MGCFDSVVGRCPKCGTELEWQSKASECLLRTFSIDSVPVSIAEDISGETNVCHNCQEVLKIIPNNRINNIQMRIISFQLEDEED